MNETTVSFRSSTKSSAYAPDILTIRSRLKKQPFANLVPAEIDFIIRCYGTAKVEQAIDRILIRAPTESINFTDPFNLLLEVIQDGLPFSCVPKIMRVAGKIPILSWTDYNYNDRTISAKRPFKNMEELSELFAYFKRFIPNQMKIDSCYPVAYWIRHLLERLGYEVKTLYVNTKKPNCKLSPLPPYPQVQWFFHIVAAVTVINDDRDWILDMAYEQPILKSDWIMKLHTDPDDIEITKDFQELKYGLYEISSGLYLAEKYPKCQQFSRDLSHLLTKKLK